MQKLSLWLRQKLLIDKRIDLFLKILTLYSRLFADCLNDRSQPAPREDKTVRVVCHYRLKVDVPN